MLSTFSNIFTSETTGPIEAKFHVEPPWDGGTKVVQMGLHSNSSANSVNQTSDSMMTSLNGSEITAIIRHAKLI